MNFSPQQIIGLISFETPWVLSLLVALPLLWWVIQVTPPPPKRIQFPAIMLLTGLLNRTQSSDKAPWWLVALRLALVSLLIIAFAEPIIKQKQQITGQGAILFIIENDWVSGQVWQDQKTATLNLIEEARRLSRPIYIATTVLAGNTDRPLIQGPLTAQEAVGFVSELSPAPIEADMVTLLKQIKNTPLPNPTSIIWVANDLTSEDEDSFLKQLDRHGAVSVLKSNLSNPPITLTAHKDAKAQPSSVLVSLQREAPTDTENRPLHLSVKDVTLQVIATDGRLLSQQQISLKEGETDIAEALSLPQNLVSEIGHLKILGQNHAGAVFLFDDRWRNTEIGIIQSEGEESLPLLSESYYLDKAMESFGNISAAPYAILNRLQLSVLLLPDEVTLTGLEEKAILEWVQNGGLLIRFAGRNLAASGIETHPLLPLRIRTGGRALTGKLQWEKPAKLKEFVKNTPLEGVSVPKDVIIQQQVLAASGPEIEATRWASLDDGTSLISGRQEGKGWLVLFHTTANSDWSNLPLSGAFPTILEHLSQLPLIADMQNPTEAGKTALSYPPIQILDGLGALTLPNANTENITLLEEAQPTPETPPGIYGHKGTTRALNLSTSLKNTSLADHEFTGITYLQQTTSKSFDFKPWLILIAFVLFLTDYILSLALRGQLPQVTQRYSALILFTITVSLLSILPNIGHAQSSFIEELSANTASGTGLENGTALAYIKTGDAKVDQISYEGLTGLSFILNQRTAIEATEPVAIELSKDELSFYPLLYWPVTAEQRNLSATEIETVNRYLAFGGSILFDLRSQIASATQNAQLQRLTRGLNIPKLVTIDEEHVLTKSFYLLQDFPGRWQGGDFWVEPISGGTADGVSRVMVGKNDWSAAWALDSYGRPRYPVTPGGENQREYAYRFGVNLMMYMLTGNYKKDQVHIPAIIKRLGH